MHKLYLSLSTILAALLHVFWHYCPIVICIKHVLKTDIFLYNPRETTLDTSITTHNEQDDLPLSPLLPSLTTNDLKKYGLSNSSCDIAKELLEECSSSSPPSSQELTAAAVPEATPLGCSSSSLSQSSISLSREGTVKLGMFIQKIINARVCRVCMDRPVSATFCPCGHLMTCYQCAVECTKCPLCRSHIAYVQYVYGMGL